MDVIVLKIIAFIVLLLMGGLFAIVPFFMVKFLIKNEREAERVLALGNALSGGIFLGGGFIHLLPEASAQFLATGIDFGVPMAELLCVSGFLTVFLLEKVIFLKSTHHHPPKNEVTIDSNGMETIELDAIDGTTSSTELTVDPPEDPQIMKRSLTEGHEGHSHDHGQLEKIMDPNSHSPLPYLLMVILSVHSVIAGFAMGVQKETAEVYAIFFAILSHKWVESFALGVNLLRNGVPRRTLFKCVILYSLMVPIGLVVGSILSLVIEGSAAVILEAIIVAIASGTFIYVALVDVLLDEFRDGFDKFPKFFLAVFGFAVITVAVLLFDED